MASEPLPSPLPLRNLAPEPLEDDSPPSSPTLKARRTNTPPTTMGRIASVLSTTHKLSAYPFTLFLATHFVSTGLLPLLTRDVESANSALLFARELYQATPAVETILVPASIGVHVLSGLGLRAARYIQDKKRYGEGQFFNGMSWISISGYALLPVVFQHASFNRLWPLVLDGDNSAIGVDYAAHGFTYGRLAWWVNTVWYGLLIGGAAYHMGFGWHKYLKRSNSRKTRRAFAGMASTVAAMWAGGLAVIVWSGRARGVVGNHYDHLYRTLASSVRLS